MLNVNKSITLNGTSSVEENGVAERCNIFKNTF